MPKRAPAPLRSRSGRLVSPRSFICSRGGLFALVSARAHAEARAEAGRRFRRGGFGWRSDDRITVRKASRREVRAFRLAIEQDAAGPEGCRVTPAPDLGTQEALFP